MLFKTHLGWVFLISVWSEPSCDCITLSCMMMIRPLVTCLIFFFSYAVTCLGQGKHPAVRHIAQLLYIPVSSVLLNISIVANENSLIVCSSAYAYLTDWLLWRSICVGLFRINLPVHTTIKSTPVYNQRN